MRWVALTIAAMLLSGCLRDPFVSADITALSGSWEIEAQKDRITGVSVPNAFVITEASNTNEDYFSQPASLQLTCFDGKPMVQFKFTFKVGSDANSVLGYRFDDKPGRDNAVVRFMQLYRTVVIEDQAEVVRFVDDLKGSKVLAIRIRSINAGRTTAEFPVSESAAAIDNGFAGCPVVPVAPPVADKRRARTAS